MSVHAGEGRRRAPARRAATAPARELRFLALVCLATVVVRAAVVPQPLRNDEGGYLLVARQWHAGGPFPYGDYFVDRPPLLLAIFRLAALTEWDGAIRVLAIPFVLAFVVSAWHVGRHLGGRTGARWACGVGAALVCSPVLAADQADGELFAAVLVMAGVAWAFAAHAAGTVGGTAGRAAVAGSLAVAAPLVKQSAVEGVVVVVVLAVLTARRRDARRRAVVLAGAAAGGAAATLVACGLWVVAAGLDPATVWRDLVGVRGDALSVIWSTHPRATLVRGAQLVALAVVSGVAGAVVTWCRAVRRDRGLRGPEAVAITALVLVGVAAMVAGGSFWPSYLLQLAPVVVLATAVLAPRGDRAGTWSRRWAGVVVATALAGAVAATVVYAGVPAVWFQQRTGEWLAASAEPGDTAVVAYGHPSILEAGDLASPYPYLWSLPMRVLDGDQDGLRATLAGPEAPAWIVRVNAWNSWGIDDGRRLRDLVAARYRVVAEVCGNPVLLRRDLRRDLAPAPRC